MNKVICKVYLIFLLTNDTLSYIMNNCMTTCHIIDIKGGVTMPSQTFLNLDSSKRNKLLEAAMNEFKTVRYTEVSVNRIIQNANISRGSFYTYFTDKDDLFGYILELNKKKVFALTKEVFLSCRGDIKNSFFKLFDVFTKEIEEHDFSRFLKNIFLYFNIYKEKFDRPGHALFLYVKDSIATEEIKASDLEFIFHLFMHNLLIGITEAVRSNNISSIREQYRRKVNILCYGIYKEDKRC